MELRCAGCRSRKIRPGSFCSSSAKRVSGVRNHHRHPGSHRHDRRHDPGTCSPRPRFKANGSGIRAGLTLRHEAHKVYVQIGRHLTEVGPGDDASGMSSTPPPPFRQSKRHWLNGRHRWTNGDAPSGSDGNPRSGDAPQARPIRLDAEERFGRHQARRWEDGCVGGLSAPDAASLPWFTPTRRDDGKKPTGYQAGGLPVY